MATSGSKDFTITRADIIESALRKIGEYDAGEGVDGESSAPASMALNLIIKELVAKGADLWLRKTVTLFLQPGTQSYSLGLTGGEQTESYVETTLSAAEASGQTVLSVTSSTGMTAADRVGIKMDDDTIHWTTIVSVDSAIQITITTATDDTAASGNKVYAYTTKAYRPQKLLYVHRRDVDGTDTPVELIGENEYRNLSLKGATGPVNQCWYHPTLTNGTLYTWPTDGGSTWDKLMFVGQFLPDDFDAQNDNPDFPIEWGNVLIWRLAAELSHEYGLPRLDRQQLWMVSEAKTQELMDYDDENASVRFELER